MHIEKPYLLFLGDAPDAVAAKVARGIAQWRPGDCVGQQRLPGCQADLGLAELDAAGAAERGARTLVVGVANRGGVIAEAWQAALLAALDAGLDIASGLHNRLDGVPALAERATALGRRLIEVRHPDDQWQAKMRVADGEARSGRRVLTVGTDCSVGKMYTSLALEAELRRRGVPADFRATGQTGIFIAGEGVSVDAVVSDFIAGAAELLSPAAADEHWDVVEGQGSLFHPSFAGVSLGLLHGSQPDALVLCHDPARESMRGVPAYRPPDLATCAAHHIAAARLTNPGVRVVGVSANTSALDPEAAAEWCEQTAKTLGMPVVDPLRQGVAAIVDRMLDAPLSGDTAS